jgi:hypothetical protein
MCLFLAKTDEHQARSSPLSFLVFLVLTKFPFSFCRNVFLDKTMSKDLNRNMILRSRRLESKVQGIADCTGQPACASAELRGAVGDPAPVFFI